MTNIIIPHASNISSKYNRTYYTIKDCVNDVLKEIDEFKYNASEIDDIFNEIEDVLQDNTISDVEKDKHIAGLCYAIENEIKIIQMVASEHLEEYRRIITKEGENLLR